MNSCFETNLANLKERVDFGLLMLSLMRTDRAAKLGSVMCDSAPEKPVLTTQARHQRVRPILSQSPPHATRPALPSEIDRGAPAQRGPGVQAQAHKDPAGLVGVRLLASTSVPSGTASGREGRFRAAVSEEQRSHGAPECQSHRRSVNAYHVKRTKWQNGDAQGQRHLDPGQSHAAGTQGFMGVQATSRAHPRQTRITFLRHPSTMTARVPLCWVVSKTRPGFDPRASLSWIEVSSTLCNFVLCILHLKTADGLDSHSPSAFKGSRGRQVDPAIDRKQHQNVGTLPLPTVNS